MELDDLMWPTRALLDDDEERAAALGDALLRAPDVVLPRPPAPAPAPASAAAAPLLIVAASPAAAALLAHCLLLGGEAIRPTGSVTLPALATPRIPTGEAGAAGGARRKPGGGADVDDDDERAAAAAEAAAEAAAAAPAEAGAGGRGQDQDRSSLPVPEYCRGSECAIFAVGEGCLAIAATPAPPGSAAAAALATTTTSGGGGGRGGRGGGGGVPDARAGAWARGILDKLRPSGVLVVAEARGEQYRGEGAPSEALLAFTLRTTAAAAATAAAGGAAAVGAAAAAGGAPASSSPSSPLPPPLPAGTVLGGLAAAIVAECEFSGVPAVAVVAVEAVAALKAAHAPALGRAVAAAARALAGGGGGGGGGGAAAAAADVAARFEAAPALRAARRDMERALPAGGVYT